MSNIIAFYEGNCQDLRTSSPEGYDLKLGQLWEQAVAAALTANGLPAYRPRQWFIHAEDRKWHREEKRCRIKWDNTAKGYISNEFDKSLLRQHQRDVLVKVGKVKRLSVEVKALCPAAFDAPYIHVGCCPKWDEKKFKVHALILVNQKTGQAYVAPVDVDDLHSVGWVRRKLTPNGQFDWAVPRHQLISLEAWIDFTKVSQGI